MRGPKASVGSQHGDIRQWMGSGDGTSGGAASSSAAPALRQADLTQLAGVVAWDGASALLEGIPPTLYLGEREVTQLKERLQDASSRECPDDHLVLLSHSFEKHELMTIWKGPSRKPVLFLQIVNDWGLNDC